MTTTTIASGAGLRQTRLFKIGTDGYPTGSQSGSDGYSGIRLEGIKQFQTNRPDPQTIIHSGDDRVFAQDSLPPTTQVTATLNTGKSNLTVDALLTDTLIANVGNAKMLGRGTDKQGFEIQACVMTFRQALDTGDDSATFKVRQYITTIFPAARITPKGSQSMSEGQADENSYNVVPTVSKTAPWGAAFTENTNGFTEAVELTLISDYPLAMERFDAPGSVANFMLDFTPVSAAKTAAWVDGVVATVSSVDTTLKMATLSTPPAAAAKVVILYESDDLT